MTMDESRWRLSAAQPPNGIGTIYTPIREKPRPPATPRAGAWERTRRERAARRGTGWLPVEPAASVGSSVAAMIYGRPGRGKS